MFNPANIHMGMVVRDRDGERLGTVIAVDAGGFSIGKGTLFTRDPRVGFADVMDLDGDDIYLRESLSSLPDLPADVRGARTDAVAPDGALSHDFTGGLGLEPRDLEQARMDSSKFQDHGRYDVGAGANSGTRPAGGEWGWSKGDVTNEGDAAVVTARQPPGGVERRAALDEDETVRREAPSDLDPNTRR